MGDERDEMVGGTDALASALDAMDPRGLDWTYRQMAGKDHEDMPLQSFYDGLDFVFRDTWDPSPITEIGFPAYAEQLAIELGDDYALPARTLFRAAPLARRRSCEDMAALMGYWFGHRPGFFRRFLGDWIDEGGERLEKGEAGCAAKIFELLVTAEPSEVEARIGLGDALLASGDRDSALAAYDEALSLDPDDPERAELRRRVDELRGSGNN
jgi:tetratricopeptide (TPR) repeat protein